MNATKPTADRVISIIGLGNVFLGDDGFGPLAVETFRCQYQCDSAVEVLDLGTPGLDLAPYLCSRKLVVVVDSVQSNLPPGTVSVFCEDDFSSSRACIRVTGHDPGLWDTLTHLRIAGCGPAELIVIGTSPVSCAFGDGPSADLFNLATEAVVQIAQVLLQRGVPCNHRNAALQPNLWWLPLNSMENLNAPKANVNA